MKRRHFLTQSLATSAVLNANAKKIFSPQKTNLQVFVLGTSWGFEGSIDTFCQKIKSEGYDGIEVWWRSACTPAFLARRSACPE